MIPILYDRSINSLNGNGLGFLVDAVKCTITEERNGIYELELQYPVSGRLFDRIHVGMLVKAKPNAVSNLQLFRIYKATKPLAGIVSFVAEHISYDMTGIPIMGFSVDNVSAEEAMDLLVEAAELSCPFVCRSDAVGLKSTSITYPCSMRAALGGVRGSMLDCWGGEFEFDNFNVFLHKERGSDRGILIAYGKNLTELQYEEDLTETYTHIAPYAVRQEEVDGATRDVYIFLEDHIMPITLSPVTGRTKALVIDLSDKFGESEEITPTSLYNKAVDYVSDNRIFEPDLSVDISFAELSQTEDYKALAALEQIGLCDTVSVRYIALGVDVKAKVVKTEYDAIAEKYERITIGTLKNSLADLLNPNSTSSLVHSVANQLKNIFGRFTI